MSGKRDFLNQPAPENYVAGLGRGATGFTTRSDLGLARDGPTPEQMQEAINRRAAVLGTPLTNTYGATNRGEKGKSAQTQETTEEDEEDERFQDPENDAGLFAYGTYDQEDDEADRIYASIDARMEKRRKTRRYVVSSLLLEIEALGFSIYLVESV